MKNTVITPALVDPSNTAIAECIIWLFGSVRFKLCDEKSVCKDNKQSKKIRPSQNKKKKNPKESPVFT